MLLYSITTHNDRNTYCHGNSKVGAEAAPGAVVAEGPAEIAVEALVAVDPILKISFVRDRIVLRPLCLEGLVVFGGYFLLLF